MPIVPRVWLPELERRDVLIAGARRRPLLRRAVGRTSRELDATEELWPIFHRHLRREGI